jgi:NADP-dependent 3-hydroxy acid dehydrogenase YdfG
VSWLSVSPLSNKSVRVTHRGANTVVAARREDELESLEAAVEAEHGTPCLVAPTGCFSPLASRSRTSANGAGVTIVQPSQVRTEIVSPKGTPRADQHDPGEVLEPEKAADAILFAATQEEPTAVAQLDMYRRDMLDFP